MPEHIPLSVWAGKVGVTTQWANVLVRMGRVPGAKWNTKWNRWEVPADAKKPEREVRK